MARDRNRRRKKKKVFGIFLIILLLLIAGFGAFVYFTFDRIVIIQDQAFSVNMPLSEYIDFGLDQLQKGKLLWPVTFDEAMLMDKYYFEMSIASQNNRAKAVLFSPVASYFVKEHETDVRALFPNSVTIGIGLANDTSTFDVVLISDLDSGWLNVSAPSGYLPIQKVEDLENANENDKFVLDYRLRYTVPNESRLGVICPALERSLSPILELNKRDFFEGMTGYLYYEYKTEGKLF